MADFMSKYLNSLLTSEEIKKHGLTQADLLYIKREYKQLQNMLQQYQSSIYGKKDQSKAIQEELEVVSKIAELLSFLGQSFSDYISYIHYSISGVEKDYLRESLYRDYYKTMQFISYMLSRQHQNYELSTLFYRFYYSDIERKNILDEDVKILTQKFPGQFTDYFDSLRYLNFLYERQKSFIVTSHPGPHNDERNLYNGCKELLNNKDVALLGTLGNDTICYLGDDIFRDTMTRLMLFADLHGFSISDIDKTNQEEYASAIEGMDISSYQLEKDNEKRFYISKRGN